VSTAIDNFTSQLHDNLEAVEDSPKATLRERAKSLKHNIKSATKKIELRFNRNSMKPKPA
jgi:hypothetical protein